MQKKKTFEDKWKHEIDDKANKQLSSHIQPYIGPYAHPMRIKKHVKDDAWKGMVM
jgi:hypothetical protein